MSVHKKNSKSWEYFPIKIKKYNENKKITADKLNENMMKLTKKGLVKGKRRGEEEMGKLKFMQCSGGEVKVSELS